MPPTITPEERAVAYGTTLEIMDEAFQFYGARTPTESEYRSACEILEKHGWDSARVIESDYPARYRSIVGALAGGLGELNATAKERGWSPYSLENFCEDMR